MSIDLLLQDRAQRQPDAVALRSGTRQLTWSELANASACVAGSMQRHGLEPGNPVGLLADNGLSFVVSLLGALWLRAPVVPLHGGLPSSQLAPQAVQSGAVAIIHDEPHGDVASSLSLPLLSAESLALGTPLREPGHPPPMHHTATITFTSGTTGQPRAVPLSHGNHLASAAASARRLGTGPGDTWLSCLPLHHVGGLAIIIRALHDGFTVELLQRFEPRAVANALASGRITHASLVTRALERTLDTAQKPFSPCLRGVLVGGGLFPELLAQRARAAGLPALRTYGLTEAASQVATQAPGDTGPSCGQPVEGIEVRVEGAAGDEGMILIRGPMVSAGARDTPPGDDDWLATGDLGQIDAEGNLWVSDRRRDRIVTGGENVSPIDVETVLNGHPAVEEAAVVGLPDPSWGEVVCAVVRLSRPIAPQQLEDDTIEQLATHQRPRRWVHITEPLPRTAMGKLQRATVQAQLLQDFDATDSKSDR